MYLLLAYDNYYPDANNVVGLYSSQDEAEEAKVRLSFWKGRHYDNIEIDYQETGDNF